MNNTTIEWVINPDGSPGYSWNPITGCLNNCSYCYARKLANGRLKQRYTHNAGLISPYPENDSDRESNESYCRKQQDPFYPRFWPEKLKELPDWRAWSFVSSPERNKILRSDRRKSRGIFCCDMSDLFGIGVPEDWTRQVINAIEGDEKDRFYLLTKQPQNLAKFSPFPDNCWVGNTLTHRGQYDSDSLSVSRIMESIEAKVKFISIEPLLSEIHGEVPHWCDWLIIGAQTKPYNPPKIEWVKEIVEAADRAGVPVFLKDSLKPLFGNPSHNAPNIYKSWWGECNCFGVNLRQEFPR